MNMSLQDQPKPKRAGFRGTPNIHGRPKGAKNKTTLPAKEALEAAFEGMGGVPRLLAWGNANPGEFYRLWSKLIPANIQAEIKGGITLTPVINLSGRPEPKQIEANAQKVIEAVVEAVVADKAENEDELMAIHFVDPDGKLQTLAGHDPKAKVDSVGVSLPSKGFRTKGPDAQVNRIAALEAEVRAQDAVIGNLQAELKALRLSRRVTPPATTVTPVTPPAVTQKRTAAERQRDSRAARKAREASEGK